MWEIALARMLSNTGDCVTVWSAIEKETDDFSKSRVHPNLSDMIITDEIESTKILKTYVKKRIFSYLLSSIFMGATDLMSTVYIPEGEISVRVTKEIELGTLYTMIEVLQNELEKGGK